MLNLSFQKENPFMFNMEEGNALNKEDFITRNNPNLFAIYLASSQAKKWFRDLIIKLDHETKFHAKPQKEERCPQAVREALKAYDEERNLVTEKLNEWRKKNKDLFETQFSIPRVAKYVNKYNFPKELITLEGAIEGYKYANKFLKDTDWTPVATQPRIVILPEHKEEYKNIREEISKKVGFPGDAAIKAEVTKTVMKDKPRLCLNRQPYSSTDSSIVFAKHFYNYILNTEFEVENQDVENTEE